ncbi:hypothetical protein ACWIUD_10925 [Helicobacter sp. 23-1044]
MRDSAKKCRIVTILAKDSAKYTNSQNLIWIATNGLYPFSQ